MDHFFDAYLERLDAHFEGLKAAVTGLPQEAVDWTPGPEMNSLAMLLAHTAGATRYWIGDVTGGDPSERDRPAEFRTSQTSAATLSERLDEVMIHSRSVLAEIALADLGRRCVSPRDGRTYSAGWSLLHALEHAALHTGQAQLTRQLWEQRNE